MQTFENGFQIASFSKPYQCCLSVNYKNRNLSNGDVMLITCSLCIAYVAPLLFSAALIVFCLPFVPPQRKGKVIRFYQ